MFKKNNSAHGAHSMFKKNNSAHGAHSVHEKKKTKLRMGTLCTRAQTALRKLASPSKSKQQQAEVSRGPVPGGRRRPSEPAGGWVGARLKCKREVFYRPLRGHFCLSTSRMAAANKWNPSAPVRQEPQDSKKYSREPLGMAERAYTHIHMYTHTNLHIHIYRYTYIHMYICTYVHMYMYTYMHIYI